MGYTLRQALDMLGPHARVVVSELLGAVVEWNREFLGGLNGRPLEDERVELKTGDIVELISRSRNRFDAILLDVDNGPGVMTDSGNRRLYGREGIQACRRALRKLGCLAVWSAEPSKKFEQLMMRCSFHVHRYRVSAYKGSKSQSRFVWVASEDKKILPRGGGQPRLPLKIDLWLKSQIEHQSLTHRKSRAQINTVRKFFYKLLVDGCEILVKAVQIDDGIIRNGN
jgi:spermidine synthase